MKFKQALLQYEYSQNCLVNGKFNFWHYPGTHNEISRVLLKISNDNPSMGALVKFPAILDFVPIRQEVGKDSTSYVFNLAIAASTNSEWLTEQREVQVFDLLLRPVYEEFLRQVTMSKFFEIGYNAVPHTMYEVYTTGDSNGVLIERYGEHIDAIELHNLTLTINDYCQDDLLVIDKCNHYVTANVDELLNN